MSRDVGPVPEPWPGVRRIAVLRGGGLGDLVFALPAIEALAAAYPSAEIVLLGTPGHTALLADRPGPVTSVHALPPARGVWEPPGVPFDDAAVEAFTRSVGPVDLGVQLHGGGRYSNPFLRRFRPRWTVGCRTPDAAPLTRSVPYRYYQHEIARALEVVGLAGAAPVSAEPALAVTPTDLAAAQEALDGLPPRVVALHPGATDPRRCWPAERFADIARRCVDEGCGVVVVGSPAERELVARVTAGLDSPLVRALADLPLPGLCGVLASSLVLVGNDSGPRHLAHALGTSTVGVFWMGNVINAGPLTRRRHRVLMAWTTACPVCGQDCTREDAPRCAHDDSFVATVPADAVWAEVADLLESCPVPLGAPSRR